MVDADENLLGVSVAGGLVEAFACPFEFDIYVAKSDVHEVFDGVELAGGEDVVVRICVVHHKTEALHVVFGVSPVALRLDVAKRKWLAGSGSDAYDGLYDFLGDELVAAEFAFVVEEDGGGGPEFVVLAVGVDELETEFLGESVGTLGTGSGCFVLFAVGEVAEHFGATGENEFGAGRVVANGGGDVGEPDYVGLDRFAGMLDAVSD